MTKLDARKTGAYRGHDILTHVHGAEGYWLADYFITQTEGDTETVILSGGTADTRFTNERQATEEALDAAKKAIDLMLDGPKP
jgi:hypothetical protein